MSKSNGYVSPVENTPEGILAWPVLFEPEVKTDENGKRREIYRADIIFQDPQNPETAAALDKLRDLGYAAGVAAWGPDDTKWPQLRTKLIRECSERNPNPQTGQPWEGYEHGKLYISCQSQFQPEVISQSGGRKIIDPKEVYGGCKVIFAVNAYTYQFKGYGIKFGLVAILKTGEGKPFGAQRPDASQIFKPLLKGNTAAPGAPAGVAQQQGRRML